MISLAAATFVFEGWKSLNYYQSNPVQVLVDEMFASRDLPEAFTVADHLDLLQWIRAFVGTDQPILASMGLSR